MIDFTTDKVVYDRLVKPAKPILDYLTKCVCMPVVTSSLTKVHSDGQG